MTPEYSALKKLSLADIDVSEAQKGEKDYLMQMTDYLIASLVIEKPHIKKYRDLYNGTRDSREFRYLEESYGLESPNSVKMTPLVKPRIDALIGLLLDETMRFMVTCNDPETHHLITKEKVEKHKEEITKVIDAQLKQNELAPNAIPLLGKQTAKRMKRKFGDSFISEFEKSAQHLIKFFELDKHLDLKSKLESILEDLLLTGETYHRIYAIGEGTDPILEIVKTENLFFSLNLNDKNLDNCQSIVHREFMSRQEVLNKYGHYMTREQLEDLFGGSVEVLMGRRWKTSYIDNNIPDTFDEGYSRQYTINNSSPIEVFHTEWIANNKVEALDEYELVEGNNTSNTYKGKRFRQDKYETVRIGTDIYVNMGKSIDQRRTKGNLYKASLSYNGIRFKGRGGEPFSLAKGLKDIQDMYDIIIFHRDNLVAVSGVNATRINVAAIPDALGTKFMERLMKFITIRKTSGIELIDPSQPDANLFQHYGDSNNSVDANVLVALDGILNTLEKQADIVAGTNPQMLAQIAQKDAVTNVKIGIQQTSLINKSIFSAMSTNTSRILGSLLAVARISYKNGKTGSYTMGNKYYSFSIDPDKIVDTEFVVHITDDSKEVAKFEKIQQIALELVGAGVIDPDTVIKLAVADSTSIAVSILEDAMEEKNEEGGEASQMQQQLEQANQQLQQMQQQMKQMESQLKKAEQEASQIKQEEFALKEKETDEKINIERDKLNLDSHKIENELALKRETVQLERDQLYLAGGTQSGNAAEVKNNI